MVFPQLKKPDRSFRIGLITGIISSGLIFLLFSVVTNYNSLSDCELNFIEGIGISKKAYKRIQDNIRVITVDEIKEIASAIPEGSFEFNVQKTAIASSYFNDCLKETRVLNRAERSALKDSLSNYSTIQIENDSIQLYWIKSLEEDRDSSPNIEALNALYKLWLQQDWLERYPIGGPIITFQEFQSKLGSDEQSVEYCYWLFKKNGYNRDLNHFQILVGYPNKEFLKNKRLDSLDTKYYWSQNVRKLMTHYRIDEIELVISEADIPFNLPQ